MNKFQVVFAGLVPALYSVVARASGATGEGGHGVDEIVYVQAINFVIYVAILYFVLRKPVRSFFSGRQENYRAALTKAQAARQEAEKHRDDIQQRLETLESTSAKALDTARVEAEALKSKILQEAAELSKKLQSEAVLTAEREIERARTELREELLSQAVTLSRQAMLEKMGEQDQKRLQAEFVEKIQVVQQ